MRPRGCSNVTPAATGACAWTPNAGTWGRRWPVVPAFSRPSSATSTTRGCRSTSLVCTVLHSMTSSSPSRPRGGARWCGGQAERRREGDSMSTVMSTGGVQPPRRSKLYWGLADGWVLAKRNLAQIPRIRELLVFATIQPVMFVLLFRYVFGGAIDVGGESYVNYLMAGIFVQTVAFGSVSTGVGLAEDLQKGLVDRFRALPMARSAVLTGRTIADLVRNLFVVFVMLIVGILVGFRPEAGLAGWAGAIGLLLLLSFSFSWIGATIALLMRSTEAVQSAGFIWLFPLIFASSAFVQTDNMPGWLQTFADHQPMTQVIDAVRALLLGQAVGSHGWQALAWCLGILVVFIPLSVTLYRRVASR